MTYRDLGMHYVFIFGQPGLFGIGVASCLAVLTQVSAFGENLGMSKKMNGWELKTTVKYMVYYSLNNVQAPIKAARNTRTKLNRRTHQQLKRVIDRNMVLQVPLHMLLVC